jgi:magnesium-transporting ATPase (P-type)
VSDPPASTELARPVTQNDRTPWWSRDLVAIRRILDTDTEVGLTSQEAASRLVVEGPNELPDAPGPGPLKRLARQFRDPLVGLLLGAIAISMLAWWTDGADTTPVEPLVIAAIIVANAVIGFWQEGRAIGAVEALRSLTAAQSTVIRDGIAVDVPTRDLVPGDLVVLVEGDTVGFDGRLTVAASLEANEAALTGESLPASKSLEALDDRTDLADRSNMVFSGTSIVRGRGRAVVVATGSGTEVGRIATLLDSTTSEQSPLQRQVERLGRMLGMGVVALTGVVVGAIFVTSDIDTTSDAVAALLIAVSLAVAAVPEGLPAILTVVLALGVQRMSRRNAVVKRLVSVETLGSASVICTDKTGTLTRNEMTVVEIATASGSAAMTGSGYEPHGTLVPSRDEVVGEVEALLWAAGAANDASLTIGPEGRTGWSVGGDPTEAALLVAESKLGGADARVATSAREGELPFDADRKLMTTIDRIAEDLAPDAQPVFCGLVQFTKGAPDILLDRCTGERRRGDVAHLDEQRRARIRGVVDEFADRGLRTLAVAYRTHPSLPEPFDESFEQELVWLGLLGIADPPRTEVADVIAEATRAGVRIMMLTGDHPRTAASISGELGIESNGRIVTGAELAGFPCHDLDQIAELTGSANVFARVAPEHKLRIVQALQRDGHIVAMTGDGVNDAPALRQADIGVAMGRNGTDVSREAADMILLDDDFRTIVSAIREGRNIFADIRKFLRYLLGSNLGEVLVMVIGVLAAAPLGLKLAGDGLAVPLLATQILWINLLTDSALALALGVDPSVDDVMARPPRRLDDPIVDRPMWTSIAVVGISSALAGLIALDLELRGGVLGGDGDLTTARTMLFTTVVLAQIFNAFNSRSDSVSAFVKPFDNRLLWLAVVATVALQVAVVHLGVLNRAFDTTALDLRQWSICWALAGTVLLAVEVRKLLHRDRRALVPS